MSRYHLRNGEAAYPALRHQSCVELDFHADSVWDAKTAAGGGGCFDRVSNDLVRGHSLAALRLGRRGSGSLFRVGVAGDRSAIVDHGDELASEIIRVAFCCR